MNPLQISLRQLFYMTTPNAIFGLPKAENWLCFSKMLKCATSYLYINLELNKDVALLHELSYIQAMQIFLGNITLD